MGTIIDDIVKKIDRDYNGLLVCEEQGADMFVYIDGIEQRIESICRDTIYFEDDYYSVKFIDADIHHLVYINSVI